MAFTISPKAAPAPVEGAVSNSQAAAKARAIAMISGAAPAAQNQNQVAPEDLAAAKTDETDPKDDVTGQTTPNEASPVEETPPKATAAPAEKALSSEYAQLARKEKALRAQAQQVKAQADALAAREAEYKAKEAAMEGKYVPKDRLSKETMAVLAEAGISYEQITEMALNAPSPEAQQQASVIAKLEAKIAALEEGQTTAKKTFEESQQQAYNQAVTQLKNEAKQLVYSSDEFETIKETNSVSDVVDLITTTFKDGLGDDYPKGTLLTVEQAAKLVEDHLYEEAFKLTNLKKIQKRLAESKAAAAAPTTSSKQAESTAGGKQPAMKTLTNSVGSSRKLSTRERAILAMKGELKS